MNTKKIDKTMEIGCDKKDILRKIKNNLSSNKILYTCLISFIIAFFYSLVLSSNVPFFWDDHFLNDAYNRQTMSELCKELIRIDYGDIASTPRTFFTIFFKIVFYLFGYDILLLRAAKSFVFSSLIVILFCFTYKQLKDYELAVIYSLFITFSFALYSRLIPYDDPYILSEFFKIAAFYIFINDFISKKSSVLNQILIAIFAFIAMRTYQVAYSIPLTLSLFIILRGFKHIKRYIILIILLFATNLLYINILTRNGGSTVYQLSLTQLRKFLVTHSLDYILSPAINLSNLYYMPLVSVITFFGFWLFAVLLSVYLLRKRLSSCFASCFAKFKENKKDDHSHKDLSIFLLIWIITEIPLWIVLPDNAIRYVSSVLIPLMILFFILIHKTLNLFNKRCKNIAFVLIILIISLACVTNVVYSVAFRAGWGSAFIGFEKVTDYIEAQRNNDSIILYYSEGVAAEYVPVKIIKPSKNFNGTYYVIQEGVEYRQIRTLDGFSSENLKNLSEIYKEVYIIKRLTSFSRHEIPHINFGSYQELMLLEEIKGDTDSLFDKMAYSAAKILKIDYTSQIFYVYRYNKDDQMVKK